MYMKVKNCGHIVADEKFTRVKYHMYVYVAVP